MAQLRITDGADVERATLLVDDYNIRREEVNVIPDADVWVTRDRYADVTGARPGEDRAYLEVDGADEFGGILRAPEGHGGQTKLVVTGNAQYMKRAPPVPTGEHKVAADDSALIQECVDATPELTAGTIETIETGQTWVFGAISQWAKAVKVANEAGAELEVTTDRVVNYTSQRGSDRTATTLSPANQSFAEDTFIVSEDGVSGNTTHLLVTGVGQGTAQVEVAIVPADDTTTYSQFDRVETYANPNWSDGDPAIWAQRGNKDLKNADVAASWGTRLMAELPDAEVRVSTVVKSDPVALGDRFHVEHPEEGIDQNLRAVSVVELLTDDGGRRWETTFSNYSIAHQNPVAEDRRNANRYGTSAYEGDLTNIQQGPGRGPVNAGHDYVLSVYYPDDVVAEVDAQLNVVGLNYRAYVAGGAGGGDHTHNVDVTHPEHSHSVSVEHPSHSHSVSVSHPSHSHSVSVTHPSHSHDVDVYATEHLHDLVDGITSHSNTSSETADGSGHTHTYKVGTSIGSVTETSETSTASLGTTESTTSSAALGTTSSETSSTELGTTESTTSSAELGTTSSETSDPSGTHTHPPEPGILDWDGSEQSPAYYPQDVDILVNGTSLGHALGDGTGRFEEVVDVGGELTAGWNTIRLTSAQLGHLDATYSADLFRQSL